VRDQPDCNAARLVELILLWVPLTAPGRWAQDSLVQRKALTYVLSFHVVVASRWHSLPDPRKPHGRTSLTRTKPSCGCGRLPFENQLRRKWQANCSDLLSEWRPVQLRISSFTRACSNDALVTERAMPLPRTSLQISCELHVLPQNAGEHPPYIWSITRLEVTMCAFLAEHTRAKAQAWSSQILRRKISMSCCH
jgi:hypothetical protein